MLIFTKKSELTACLSELKKQKKTLGFVPTMGALHKGHLSLIAASKASSDVTICSIFVNPTQFNDKSDLERYPRMPEKDLEMLKNAGCDLVFMPGVDEMYKDVPVPRFDLGSLNMVLEAAHRPGHFDGVAQVVKRFFDIIQPDKAFFGSKDYQQVMVVKAMTQLSGLTVDIIACPILREDDGLAMSSRNALLSKEERETAAQIPLIMLEAKKLALGHSIGAAKLHVMTRVQGMKDARMDYYEIVEAHSLRSLSHLEKKDEALSLIALFVGKIRLIDNLTIQN